MPSVVTDRIEGHVGERGITHENSIAVPRNGVRPRDSGWPRDPGIVGKTNPGSRGLSHTNPISSVIDRVVDDAGETMAA